MESAEKDDRKTSQVLTSVLCRGEDAFGREEKNAKRLAEEDPPRDGG